MRLKPAQITLCFCIAVAACAPLASAQNPDDMMPEQSTALAKKIVGQLIDALGGPTFLQARQMQCTGRLAQFEHSGALSGYTIFQNSWGFPDKNRAEYVVKGSKFGVLSVFVGSVPIKGGRIVQVYSGDHGWTLDRGGVSELPPEAVAQFQEQLKRGVDNLLRFRLNEQGLTFRYGGLDLIDMLPVDWVEITDSDERQFRLAVRRDNHLLARSVVTVPDQATHDTTQDTTIFANYHAEDGVQTPLQVTRQRDGRRIFQVFYDSCSYDPNLPADFFSKESLEKHAPQTSSRKDQ